MVTSSCGVVLPVLTMQCTRLRIAMLSLYVSSVLRRPVAASPIHPASAVIAAGALDRSGISAGPSSSGSASVGVSSASGSAAAGRACVRAARFLGAAAGFLGGLGIGWPPAGGVEVSS